DPVMGALLRTCTPAEIVAALIQGRLPVSRSALRDEPEEPGLASPPGPVTLPGLPSPPTVPGLSRALDRWAARMGEAPAEPALDAWGREGIRLVCPGDSEWPSQLDVLGDARPWALWVRGNGDLRYTCLRSVSIVGTRSVTAYGSYVCTDMAATLAE